MVTDLDSSSLNSYEEDVDCGSKSEQLELSNPLDSSHVEGAVVLQRAEQGETCPTFGNICISNGSDIHFGNKTFYQGPVTIKQFVLTDAEKLKKISETEISPSDVEKFSQVDLDGGIVNPSFERESSNNDEVGNTGGTSEAVERTSSRSRYLKDPTKIKPLVLKMVSRWEWLAQPPTQPTTPLKTPVPYVIISHTATETCLSQAQCVFQVRYIQTFHIESRGWFDIGYNFLVGGDAEVYIGRGWEKEGSHTLGYNKYSIGISFIGTFIDNLPTKNQLVACKRLIQKGVELGYIKKDYKLLGARQLQTTQSPGTKLFEEIKKWPHWTEEP
ncbi:peptidoglycan-recognition protein LE-like isoform X2 [Harmonia axyridis]|uniref:peptidoglycan-recognition protein LE-like isoform X2 n=1 Tax=Harmonia axyridis TaxID=115357 RepID=UPI001E275A20|nr:peptidoglycan-recognition protein LE-like isoform X2 [Harmonia axyridis]